MKRAGFFLTVGGVGAGFLELVTTFSEVVATFIGGGTFFLEAGAFLIEVGAGSTLGFFAEGSCATVSPSSVS